MPGPRRRVETKGANSCRARNLVGSFRMDLWQRCASLRCPPLSPFLPLPGYFCVGAALDPDKSPRVAPELRMMGLEQVLSDHGQFKIPCEAPTETHIRCCVSWHKLGRQGAHIAKGLIKLQVLGQIQRRLDHYLMVRAGPLRGASGCGVEACRPFAQFDIQVGVRASQAPPVCWRPIWRDFDSGRVAQKSVAEEKRDYGVHGRRRGFQKRRAGLQAEKITVVVIKYRDIHV